jgi:hypothetical protein
LKRLIKADHYILTEAHIRPGVSTRTV